MRIAVENSTWNNIGDAFYQMSIQNMLKTALPTAEIFSFDGPGGRAFRPGRHAQKMYDVRKEVDADHFVLSGPILNPKFIGHYAPLIKKIVTSGASYSMLSIHSWEHHDHQATRSLLKEFPPVALHTRDAPSFKRLEGIADCQMDGVCFAFFVARIDGIPRIKFDEPTIASSFYRGAEPKFIINKPEESILSANLEVKHRSSNYWRIRRHFEFRQNQQEKLGKYKIVRPVHGFYPFPHLLFARQNSYITYNPLNMLGVYKASEAVITDRVHSAVAGLSFGRPAYVEKVDGRFAIFEKVAFKKEGGFFMPNQAALDVEYSRIIDWLKKPYAAAISKS